MIYDYVSFSGFITPGTVYIVESNYSETCECEGGLPIPVLSLSSPHFTPSFSHGYLLLGGEVEVIQQ